MAERRIFHLDLDAFFVAVERAFDPSLIGKPVVVGGDPKARGVVACASYEARAYGLHAGMPLVTAHRLCPQAVFLQGRFHRYREASDRFKAILQEYTPFIESLGLDEAHLDMTGFDALYGPLIGVAREMKRRVQEEVKVTVSVGIASSKVTAKVAAGYGKPDGLVEIPYGEDAQFLAPLKVSKLPGVGPKAEAALRRLGIKTIGELASTPPTTLRRGFGAWGDLLHMWACGLDHSPVHSPAPAKSISRETTFPQDVSDIDFLMSTLRYLTERVAAELRKEEKQARCVVTKVRYSDFQTITRHRTMKTPVDWDDAIFQAAAPLLAQATDGGRRLVRLIGVGVANLAPRSLQLPLLDMAEDRQRRLALTMDSVRQRYGFPALQTGRTFRLGNMFPSDERGYILKTPALSR